MKIVKKIIIWIITILLVLLFTFNIYNFVCVNILKQDLATIGGYGVLEVISGSMEPTIHVGDLVIINTNETNYGSNDIVTFYDVNGAFVTHRILSIKDGKMITQGDNNNAPDESISTDNIVGKYVFQIPLAGRILESLRSPFTMVMILLIGILICMLLSMDSNGEPILTDEEKEYREFQEAQKKKKLKMAYAEGKAEPLLVEKMEIEEIPVEVTEQEEPKEEQLENVEEKQLEIIEEKEEAVVEPVIENEITEEEETEDSILTTEEVVIPEIVEEPVSEEVEPVVMNDVEKEEITTLEEEEHRIELSEKNMLDTYLLNKEEYEKYLEYLENKKAFKHFLKFQTNKKQYKDFREFNRMKVEFEKFLEYSKNKGKYKKFKKHQKKEYKKYQKLEKLETKRYLKIQKQKEKANKKALKNQMRKQEYQRFLEYQKQEYKGFMEYQSKGKIEIQKKEKKNKNKKNKKKEK